ncbi:hypothetical protein Taro_007822 [Colocasia esculenta]|uniref:Uncharacterized protein n=1 Tax=Colocasia esculenta TaxID=4460 RepID=A0A843TWI3_COLES|nr:hypothetical protein [Colocasia esculenta]
MQQILEHSKGGRRPHFPSSSRAVVFPSRGARKLMPAAAGPDLKRHQYPSRAQKLASFSPTSTDLWPLRCSAAASRYPPSFPLCSSPSSLPFLAPPTDVSTLALLYSRTPPENPDLTSQGRRRFPVSGIKLSSFAASCVPLPCSPPPIWDLWSWKRTWERLMQRTMEEGKQLDFSAPLLSVRRFATAPPPTPPSSSSSAKAPAAVSSRAEVGGWGVAGERPRRSSLPFYKSDLKSGPVTNPGVVPFVWEQSPGRPKDGSFPEDSPSRRSQPPVLAPKPPPGRIARRPPDEKEESMTTDVSNPPSNNPYLRRSSPLSSSTSVHTTVTTTTAATITASPSTANAASSSKTLQSSREEPKGKARTPPVVEPAAEAPISKEQRSVNDEEDEEEDAFSDALDTLSRTESFFMNCSISGMTGGTEPWGHPGRFLADPQVQDFMMERFLPAAQAMATDSPLCPPRKAAEAPRGLLRKEELRRPAASLPPVQRSSLVSTYPRGMTHQLHVGNGEDSGSDDDDDYDDAGRPPMKGCGLLPRFCLKGSFGLLNPVPGMKARGRMPLPGAPRLGSQLRISRRGSVIDADDEHSWEDVYKYNLRRESQAMGEEGSRITSESNRLSYWTDSQTPDGSSPYRRSNAGGVSPYRNDMPPFPFHEGRGFLGLPKSENGTGGKRYAAFEQCAKDDGEHCETSPHLNSKEECGSVSPVVEKTVYMDSVQILEKSDPQFCSSDTEGMVKCLDKNSYIRGESQRIETSLILLACEKDDLLNKISEVGDAEGLCSLDAEGLGSIEQSGTLEQRNNTVDTRQDHVLHGAQPLKAEHQGKNGNGNFQPLLPPPLPKSPTESWLWRTLPSISSKNPIPQTFLGFQFHQKKQVTQATSTDPKWEAMVKTSVLKKDQTCEALSGRWSIPGGSALDYQWLMPSVQRCDDWLSTPGARWSAVGSHCRVVGTQAVYVR